MTNNFSEDPIFHKLQFTKEWIEIGVVDSENFVRYKKRYLEGENTCTEHYRYGAFRDFIRKNKKISPETLSAIYNLGKNDPDRAMGKSMRIDIIQRIDCPKELIDMAIKDEDTSEIVLKLQQKGRVKSSDR